jgi:hypothetical protein
MGGGKISKHLESEYHINKGKYFRTLSSVWLTDWNIFPFQEQQTAYDILHYKYCIGIYKYKIYILGILHYYMFEISNLINIFKTRPS